MSILRTMAVASAIAVSAYITPPRAAAPVAALSARGQNPRGIRAAKHPRWIAPHTRPHCNV